jgi:hypothetical protein
MITATGWIVEPGDEVASLGRAAGGGHAGFLGLGQHAPHRVEQEGARAAGRIEHLLLERRSHGMAHDLRRQPVGRVVFAKAVALVAVDQRFV